MNTSIVETPAMPELPTPHYHVVAFIDGCLNDYDSGPLDTTDDARIDLADFRNDGGMHWGISIVPAGQDRYVQGPYILTIEECTEECEADDMYR